MKFFKQISVVAALSCASVVSAQAETYNWSGLYVGANIGAASQHIRQTDTLPPVGGYFTPVVPAGTASFGSNNTGLIGGLQAGVQHQWNNFVLGGEIAFSGLNVSKTNESPYFATDVTSAQTRDLFAVSARAGFARDNWMAYVKGGYASADVAFNAYDRVANVAYAQHGRQGGVVLGAGFERMLSKSVTLALEYNHYDLGRKTHDGVNTLGFPEQFQSRARVDAVTARVNFLFDRDRVIAAPLK